VTVYNIYKKLKQKTIYVGCLYSQTGLLANHSYDNYKILLDSFKYAIKKYDCPINIIPIYKDLGDDMDNITKFIEECVKKYNIKYFFGCWRSSERQHVIPILQKYNLRLFYPLQYEGIESSKHVYYFGGCPNQQLMPGLKFMFDTYYYYKDVYVIGSDYSYSQLSLYLIKNFINITKSDYNKTFVYSKLYPLEQTDFTEFIQTLFNKSPNGAIIINLINGDSYYSFYKQFVEMYSKRFPEINSTINTNQDEAIKYLSDKKLKNILKISERYPSITTSIFENTIKKEYSHFLEGNIFVK
jgi:urea transport system substrate-binding protein